MLDGKELLEELAGFEWGAVLAEIVQGTKNWVIAVSHRSIQRPQAAESIAQSCSLECDPNLSLVIATVRNALRCPSEFQDETLAWGCREIAKWAEGRFPETHFAFTVAAGLCNSESIDYALYVGRLARERANWAVADGWLKFAAAEARRQRDREAYVVAIMSLGNTYVRQGNYELAEGLHRRALAFSRRFHIYEYEGRALHDLSIVSIELGKLCQAELLLADAFRVYGPSHRLIPFLAHDVAYCWLKQEKFEIAAAILAALLPYFRKPPSAQVRVLGNLARAVAGCGDLDRFLSLWNEIWSLVDEAESTETFAVSLVSLAEGAISLGQWEIAQHAAIRCLQLGIDRGELDIVPRAESVLWDAMYSTMPIGTSSGEGVSQDKMSEQFAEQLIRSLVADQLLREHLLPGTKPSRPTSEKHSLHTRLLNPNDRAQGTHTVFDQQTHSGRIVEYLSFRRQIVENKLAGGWLQTLHFHLDGNPSFNRATRTDVLPPHVHDISVPGGVRAALPHEIPARPW